MSKTTALTKANLQTADATATADVSSARSDSDKAQRSEPTHSSDAGATAAAEKGASASSSSVKSFNPSTVRMLGAFLMFLGLMLCVLLNSTMGLFVTVASLAALVLGFYLTISGMRIILGKSFGKEVKNKGAVWLIVGILLIAAGVLGLLYRDAIASYVLVFLGALIGIFGLVMLVMLAVAQRGPKKTKLDIVMSVSTMVLGVLIALLVIPTVGNSVNHLCYYLFGALAIAIGGIELVTY